MVNGENGVNTETPSMVCHVEAITDACIDTKPSVSSMSTSLRHGQTQKSPDTPGSPEGNTEGPGTASSEPLLPS